MMRRRVMLALFGTALLAGCGLTRPSVDVHTYLIVPGAPKADDSSGSLRLLVAPFDIAPPYDGKPMVYRFSDARFQADFYNEYLVAPRMMLMEQTTAWLRRAGYDATTSSRRDAYSLRAKVVHLYGDFRDAHSARAVLDIVFVLGAPNGGQTLLERHYAAAVPIADRSADSMAQGLGKALAQILAQLHADLRTLEQR